jgi:hypothetical protein
MLTIAFVNAQDVQHPNADKLTFEKGTQFVNANFFVSTSKDDVSFPNEQFTETTQNQFNTRASYAYAIGKNLFLGLSLRYTHQTVEQESNNAVTNGAGFSSNTYGIFPYVRYFKGLGKKLAAFFQGSAGYRHTNFGPNKTNEVVFGLRPGITFMMNKNLALETSLGFLEYSFSNSENEDTNTEQDFNGLFVSLSTSNLLLGVTYYF